MYERPKYIWHVERRDDGLYYAIHNDGGWMRFQGKDEAEAYVDRQVKRGDSRKESVE